MLEHFQDLQIRPQARRLEILELLNDLMSKHRAALKEMGNESIIGVTDLVSGEKDPRNLMVIFSILKVIMVEWEISAHAEVCPILHSSREGCSQILDVVRLSFLLFSNHFPTSTR